MSYAEIEEEWRDCWTLKEAKRIVAKHAVSGPVVQRGSFTLVVLSIQLQGKREYGYGFAKCNRRLDQFDAGRGIQIATGRATAELARLVETRLHHETMDMLLMSNGRPL